MLAWNSWTKFQGVVDNKLIVTKMTISVFHSVGNIVGKRRSASYQHVILFSQSVEEASFLEPSKIEIVL